MSKPRKDEPLKMPRYRGGESALKSFIEAKLKYPQEALDQKIEGPVEASYDVDGLGRIANVRILKSLGHGCDQEVIRLVKLLKFEKAFNKGRNVTAHKKLKVDFKLPKEKKPTIQKVQYELVSDKPKHTSAVPKEEQKITYSIKF